jgi:2-C-methyl-D-erythritol 2,4-cyclodiphosphate synthase
LPKIKPHSSRIQQVIASILGVEETQVSIKATTAEKMGFVGREEGISAYAVVLLTAINK